MNRDKAIEILEGALNGSSDYSSYPLYQASKLGKEALKRLNNGNNLSLKELLKPLPGETKE